MSVGIGQSVDIEGQSLGPPEHVGITRGNCTDMYQPAVPIWMQARAGDLLRFAPESIRLRIAGRTA